MKQYVAIGLMSGTSGDGVDASLITTDGHNTININCNITVPYSPETTELIRNIHKLDIVRLLELEKDITENHAKAVQQLIKTANISPETVDCIGFHGQTAMHLPDRQTTLQIGNSELLAKTCHIPVVHNLRRRDMVYGGQGAPLVPIYLHTLYHNQPKPLIALNIGGISNITYMPHNIEDISAYDAGPGCALIDAITSIQTNQTIDYSGNIATQGSVDESIIQKIMQDPFFSTRPPKSLDAKYFKQYLDILLTLNTEDALATASEITVRSILHARNELQTNQQEKHTWIISGGGRRNKYIIGRLKAETSKQDVILLSDEINIDGDMIEAQAMGYIAVRSLLNLPVTFPNTTGVSQPMTCGILQPAL